MIKRKHQCEFESIIEGIINGNPIKNIIVRATPGSGKSSLPIIAGKLITAGLADKLCWIAPRMSLQDQAERNFIDPFFRQMFGHRLTIRSSTNEVNPCRGHVGFCTTYQALGVDRFQTVLNEFRRRRYILILDEFHHAEEEGEWTQALMPLYEKATFRVLMTGTLERGDRKRIAFTPYRQSGEKEFMPYLEGDGKTAVIEYTRKDALTDRAIIPVTFKFSDGHAKWEKDGQEFASKISTKDTSKVTAALWTAINTEYAYELLDVCIQHWNRHRITRPSARLLIVAAQIQNAKEYLAHVLNVGLRARIATSEDSGEAVRDIKAFKAGRFDALVTVAMAYEGLDVPSISHIACLTNIRSAPWIEQMTARAARIDPQAGPYSNQRAYVFAPSDVLFREIAQKIEADQLTPALAMGGAGERFGANEGDGSGGGPNITPLESRMIGAGNEDLPLFGGFSGKIPQNMPENVQNLRTASEAEAELLEAIDSHVRKYAFQNRYSPKRLNGELYAHFGKPRREMTIKELQACMSYCQQVWPLTYIRGTGNMRVPAKAHRFAAAWR